MILRRRLKSSPVVDGEGTDVSAEREGVSGSGAKETKGGKWGRPLAPLFSKGARASASGKGSKSRERDAADAIDADEAHVRRSRIPSLRWRLTTLTALIVAFSVGLMTLAAFFTVQATLYREVDNNLRNQATQLLNSPYASEFAIEPMITADTLKILNPDLDAVYFARDSVTGRGDSISIGGPELAVLRGNRTESMRTDEFGGRRIYAIKDPSGATLILAQDLRATQEILRALSMMLLTISAVGILFAVAAGITVATTGLRPVSRLRKAAERVTATDELRPIPVEGDDELARFTRAFNDMMSALQASRIKQAELVADAGHELKTPLTSLRTNIELLMMASRSGATIPEQDRADLEADVIAQLEELSTLVGDLVDLAREDGTQQVIEEIAVEDIVSTSLERIERRRLDLTFQLDTEPWYLYGDSAALGRAVLNLMDNAAKWSPESGTVRIKLHQTSDSVAEFSVADSGPGIPVEDREKVFERFYRSIQSRSMPGSGLGLAIVKSVIVRHGGTINVEDSDDGGTLMRVTLPGTPQPTENSVSNPPEE